MMESLYIHFPFCESRCHYCDFYSLGGERTQRTDPALFENALRVEANRVRHLVAPKLQTIFMGGGTPSLTPVESMKKSLHPLLEVTSVHSEIEWTMEANPSSITLDAMRAYRSFGINRISMGLQAMQDHLLTLLGRVHSKEAALNALEAVFSAGFTNVSVDLLCGVPEQTIEDLEESLTRLMQYPITHLSCYLLTLPQHHRMYKKLPDEETQLNHLLWVDQWMTRNGFEHYEISNFARPGKKSQHNLRYWMGKSYLGLGPSAHSYNADVRKRWKNISSLHKYGNLLGSNSSPVEWTEILTEKQYQLEKWMLALRLNDGFPADWLKTKQQQNRAQQFWKDGLLETHPGRQSYWRLTPRGFALSDHVIRSFA